MRAEMTLIGNNCSPIVPQIFPRQKRTLRRPLSDLKETAGPPLLLASFRGLSVRVRETPWLVCGSPVLVAPRVAEISHSASAKLKPQAQLRLRARGRLVSSLNVLLSSLTDSYPYTPTV